ncbi:MAG: DUF1501 domain-containing protein [Planctomycetota bacterium]
MATQRFCDGVVRRDFLKIGALSGLTLPGFLRLSEAGQVDSKARAKSAIFIRLAGGPSHMDTFDMKPEAPDTHRGSFGAIDTNVDGLQISEHLPKLAKCADKFSVVRGVTHNLGAHRLGTVYLTTGNRPLPSLRFPTYGAVASKEWKSDPELPPYVAIPNDVDGSSTGFIGVAYGPFSTGETPKPGRALRVRGLSLPGGVKIADVDRRQKMLERYDTAFQELDGRDELLNGLDRFSQRAYSMLRSRRARDAFDTTKESRAITSLFAEHSFSQSCLLATRLIEAGVRFVTLNFGGWDTHADNFTKLKDQLLPGLDSGLAGLYAALEQKGLLDSTSVFVTGEFGRTPKINVRGGRDHYPRAMFCLLAGGGMKGGQVVGASDALGTGPDSIGISPDDVAATFYHSLGIDVTKEFLTPSGRPVMIVRHGKPIADLF